jgi:hypothetical protein
VTVKVVVPLIDPDAALMTVGPDAEAVANPAALIVATDVTDEVQVTALVTSALLPFVKWPVAVNCTEVPMAVEGFAGVTTMELSPVLVPVPLRVTTA